MRQKVRDRQMPVSLVIHDFLRFGMRIQFFFHIAYSVTLSTHETVVPAA